MAFTNILPEPNYPINKFGEQDAGGIGPGYAKIKLRSVYPMMKFRSPSQRYDTAAVMSHRWEIDIQYNPLTCEDFFPVFSFLLRQRTLLQPFYVSLPPYDTQTTLGKTNDYAVSKGSKTVTVTGTGCVQGEIFTFNNHDKVYKITRVETNTNYLDNTTAPLAGEERLHITPQLQTDLAGTETVTFINPLFKMKQLGDTMQYNLNKEGLFVYSIKLEEVI